MEFVKSNLRLERELHKRFKIACAERGQTMEAATVEGIVWWMGVDPVAAATRPPAADQQESAQLADFLRTGEPGQVKVVRMILEEHAKAQRTTRKRSSA